MKTTFLNDKHGHPIKVGTKVIAGIQGCMSMFTVSKLRPRKKEIVIRPGGYFYRASDVTTIKEQ